MAVPTFTSINPATGLAMGRFIAKIFGSNFRLPPDPPATGYVGGTYLRTVKVEVDGVESIDVRVLTESLLTVLVPEYRGPSRVEDIGVVDIRVTNLDDDGEEIPGETVTAVDAFTFYRPLLDRESDFKRLVRELIRIFRRQIIANTNLRTHTDYDDTVGDMMNIVKLSELPGIILVGPIVRHNRFYSKNVPDVKLISGMEYVSTPSPKTVDLVFRIIGVAEHEGPLLQLLAAVEDFFGANTVISMNRDPDDLSLGRIEWDMEIEEEPEMANAISDSNVGHFEGSFLVRAFDIEKAGTVYEYNIDETELSLGTITE